MMLSDVQISTNADGDIEYTWETTYTQTKDSDGCPVSAEVKAVFTEYDEETGEKSYDEVTTWTEEYSWKDLGKSSTDIP